MDECWNYIFVFGGYDDIFVGIGSSKAREYLN